MDVNWVSFMASGATSAHAILLYLLLWNGQRWWDFNSHCDSFAPMCGTWTMVALCAGALNVLLTTAIFLSWRTCQNRMITFSGPRAALARAMGVVATEFVFKWIHFECESAPCSSLMSGHCVIDGSAADRPPQWTHTSHANDAPNNGPKYSKRENLMRNIFPL